MGILVGAPGLTINATVAWKVKHLWKYQQFLEHIAIILPSPKRCPKNPKSVSRLGTVHGVSPISSISASDFVMFVL